MTDSSGSGHPRASRRRILQTMSGLTTLGILGTGASTTVAADPGDELWAFETDRQIESSPTVVDGTVFIGCTDYNLYAVDAETGEQEWAFQTGDEIYSSPTVVDGTVFVGSWDSSLYAVDTETGEQEWSFETGRAIHSSPIVVDGTVFVGSWDSSLYAVDTETGEQEWSFETGGSVSTSPTVVDGTVFVGSWDRSLYAADTETGDEQWVFETGGYVDSSPTVVDGTAFFGSRDYGSNGNNLYAVDTKTGEQEWDFQTGRGIRSSPTVADGTVFVGSDDNNLYAVDTETGEEEWVFQTGDGVWSSPTVADETVFVGSNDNNLYAVDTETGAEQWAFKTGGSVGSSPTVVDGTIFVGSDDNNLYAVDTGFDRSSDGSRVLLGTKGHHADWQYADQTINIPAYALYASWVRNNIEWITIGGAGIGAVAGGRFLLPRLKLTQQSEQESSEESSGELATTSSSETDQPTTPTEQSETDSSSRIDTLRSEAEMAFETAISARENNNFDEAADAYSEAVSKYQATLEELDAGATETRTEIENSLDSTREDLHAVNTRTEQRESVSELLEAAEQSFQVAIIAYTQRRQTLARIRFRQARDSFEEAIDLLEDNDDDLLTPPVEVSVQSDRELVSTAFSEIPMIPEAETAALADSGVETLEDLDSTKKPPWTPTVVETLENKGTTNDEAVTTLTLLSWWNDTDSYEFNTVPAVSRRRDQADYGFTQSS